MESNEQARKPTVEVVFSPLLYRDKLTRGQYIVVVADILRAGARGYLLKNTDPGDLLAGIRTVAGGETFLSPRIASSNQWVEVFISAYLWKSPGSG